MRKHKQVYMEHFGYCVEDVVLCEVCGGVACDIHHIEFKSQGGTDHLINLVALCRHDHDMAHGKIKDRFLSRDDLFEITTRRK